MSRYVIDAPTLLHLVDGGLAVHADHKLVAPNSLREAAYLAVTRLQADALATVDAAMTARADGIVPVVPVKALLIGD